MVNEIQKENVLEQFEDYLYAKEDFDDKTCSDHRVSVRNYIDYHGELLPEPPEQKGLAYKSHIKKQGKSASHVNNIVRAIEYYYEWRDDVKKPDLGRMNRRETEPAVLSKSAYNTVLRKGLTNKRDMAIFLFMTSSGIRVSECVQLDIRDIQWNNNRTEEIPVKGQGDRTGDYLFSSEAKEAMNDYLETRYNTEPDDPLFTSLKNSEQRLKRNGYNQLFERVSERAGVEKFGPHHLRGYFITEAIRQGVDLKTISEWVNHRSIEMTSKYVQLAEQDKQEKYDQVFNS